MELRKDYILDRYVIVASERKKRKKELKKKTKKKESGTCFFCPGSEKLTPPEIGRIEKDGKWKMRWFDNKFPVVEQKGNPEIRTDNTYFTFSDAYGQHEVIVETNDHKKQLWDLGKEDITQLLNIYKERIKELSQPEEIKYVIVFKNHGAEAGTSLIHSHTQVSSINIIPPLVMDEVNASERYMSCPYCSVIDIEKNSYRKCFENNTFVAFTPYASRFNYEIWVFPKRHVNNITKLTEDETKDLAEIMKNILDKLKKKDLSFNFFLHHAPKHQDLHFHIEITPRHATWAGFEFSSDIIINSVTPEDAAKYYREEEE